MLENFFKSFTSNRAPKPNPKNGKFGTIVHETGFPYDNGVHPSHVQLEAIRWKDPNHSPVLVKIKNYMHDVGDPDSIKRLMQVDLFDGLERVANSKDGLPENSCRILSHTPAQDLFISQKPWLFRPGNNPNQWDLIKTNLTHPKGVEREIKGLALHDWWQGRGYVYENMNELIKTLESDLEEFLRTRKIIPGSALAKIVTYQNMFRIQLLGI